MNLLIHDLKPEDWDEIKQSYAGWHIVFDNGTIRPASGAFPVGIKHPGSASSRMDTTKSAS